MIAIMLVVLLLPLLAAAFISVVGRRLENRSAWVAVAAVATTFVGAVVTLVVVASHGAVTLQLSPPTLSTPAWPFRLYIDRLSAVMMVVISGVSAVVHVYSIRYMFGERGYGRFYALLGCTTTVLLTLVSSGDLLLFFICWQLVSWLLYLLLAYNYIHAPAINTAFKTWMILRVGDLAFMGGVLLTFYTYGTLDFVELFDNTGAGTVLLSLWSGGPAITANTLITLLLFVGAMAKSAQFPLHVWLPTTMDTPTPVSALMHAGIINAGGFLINRLAPLYGAAPATLHVAVVVGALTVFIGATIMLTQTDVKKMLGYSTMGQMGYMIMECGFGAFALAIFHLMAHGVFKATLFLSANTTIHEARQDPRLPLGHAHEQTETSPHLPWITGVILTLVVPLVILLAAHGVLRVPLHDAQGAIVFLFFAWVTSAQAILTLYRLRAEGNSKVMGLMVAAIFVVMGTYLWAAEAFTYFLYPTPGQASRYFHAAAFPLWLFDLSVAAITLLIIVGWAFVYTNARGEHRLMPAWATRLMPRLYVWFWNGLYVDVAYARLGRRLARLARRMDATVPEWLP